MRGSVLVESVLALNFLILPFFALQAEVVRVVWCRAVLQITAFHYVRHRALGSSREEALKSVHWLSHVLLDQEKRQARSKEHWESEVDSSGDSVWARVQVRYHSWFPFVQDRVQVTERCQFTW